MKDKLMELLNSCGRCDKYGPNGCGACEYRYADDECEKHLRDIMSDDLLDAGVVVLPVKPGDTVYIINRNKIKEWKVYFVGMNLRGEVNFYVTDEKLTSTCEFWDYNIGVCVFLTEEDAINALKERKAYDNT